MSTIIDGSIDECRTLSTLNESSTLLKYNSKSFYDGQSESITKNLSSLRFDAGIIDPARRLLFLRRRSQMVTINIVSHAVFTASIVAGVKRKVCKSTNSEKTRIKVGIIGCGRLGTHIIHGLLEYTNVLPKDIKVSTRRPEVLLMHQQTKEITCFQDNTKASNCVDILFLCFPPHQTSKVLSELAKGDIASHCLVYSVVAGVTSKKISEMIEHDLVFNPSYTYGKEDYMNEDEWSYGGGIVNCMAINMFKQLTCPLIRRDECEALIVQIDDVFLHCLFLQMINMCKYCSGATFDVQQSVELCNDILFRGMTGFTFDLVDQIETLRNEKGYFKINEIDNEIKESMELEDSLEFIRNFEKHYKIVFDRFVDWLSY